jgi:hypothetical protein
MIAYKYRSGRGPKDSNGKDIFERDIELLSQDMIYIPTVEQLNDPSEALVDDRVYKMQRDLFERIVSKEAIGSFDEGIQGLFDSIRNSGIYSLSKEIANELMWAYYANGHNGYAIIFDTEVLVKSFENGKYSGMHELEVKYSSRLPQFDISIIELDINKVLSCLVGNKSDAWKHEAEHRLVFDIGGKCLKIDYRAIKGFVFGCKMNPDDMDYVMKTFSGRDLTYYQIRLKDDSYNLFLERLTDGYPDAEKYCPNKVEYDVEALLEYDRSTEGVGYKYRPYVEEALMEISREPFVTFITHIVVTDDKKHPNILVWTKIKQDGSFRKTRQFEFDVIDGSLVRK